MSCPERYLIRKGMSKGLLINDKRKRLAALLVRASRQIRAMTRLPGHSRRIDDYWGWHYSGVFTGAQKSTHAHTNIHSHILKHTYLKAYINGHFRNNGAESGGSLSGAGV